ncbi:Protein CBG18149 [Caenorhabditis briggsae]|uniref:Uncharacterized protein n=2 Tax=Caenorhabditis briggsae TaxID=6238 RepID=A0AAE9IP89_CAEBR|nr:Protein CBG18149 [Caenorhabditis briggsae]ULU00528.1 hypothetical protein L3Y34_001177 [Caenorhabditis briggsae]CAP35651.1 Protein CBG18149 [Caenorhabditis briggsae]
MAPSNSKNNKEDIASDGSSAFSTGTSLSSYDGGSESSSYSTASSRSPSHLSRRDSFYSASPSTNSSLGYRRHRSPESRSHSSHRSGSSVASDVSRKSILKNRMPTRRRSVSRKSKMSPKRKSTIRPVGNFAMIKNPAIKNQVRGFLNSYSQSSDFEAFSLSVDGIPFVALSLLSADEALLDRFKPQPPTPMKKHVPGVNNPRKRLQPHRSTSSSSSKQVRFTDEGASTSAPKKSKKSLSNEEIHELGQKVSDAMLETDRQYDDLWKDRKD